MEDQLYKYIGNVVRTARDLKKWTQQELSDKMSLTRSSIANIELGRQKIQVHVLYELAKVLDITVVELLPTAEISNKVEQKKFDEESNEFLEMILNNEELDNGGDE